jgi:SAM-dependent methyltransferase
LVSSNTEIDPSIYDKSYVLTYKRYDEQDTGVAIKELRCMTVRKHLKDGRVLDYGCGTGAFIGECRYHGYDAVGYDINPNTGFCDPLVLLDSYDVVTFWDSLEHVDDPAELIMRLDAEWVFICTPSTDDCSGDLTKWRHYKPVEHKHYFNEKSLRALLDVCGYDVVECHYDESQLRTGGGQQNIITIGGRKRV